MKVAPLHEIAKLEYTYRFLYFLRDIGIKSAHGPAVETWQQYMFAQSEVMISESTCNEPLGSCHQCGSD